MDAPAPGVLARLPLQIGTTATWSAGRAAAALFPGLAVLGSAVAVAIALGQSASDGFKLVLVLIVMGLLLVGYAIAHMVGAIRNRASDVMLRGSENIVGLDLRPSVNQARAEQQTFDEALRTRSREKRLWTTLSVVSAFVLLGWAGGTAAFVMGMERAPTPAAPGPPATTAPAPTAPAIPPKPVPSPPHPGPMPTKKGK